MVPRLFESYHKKQNYLLFTRVEVYLSSFTLYLYALCQLFSFIDIELLCIYDLELLEHVTQIIKSGFCAS
jgi:hypothetical protein